MKSALSSIHKIPKNSKSPKLLQTIEHRVYFFRSKFNKKTNQNKYSILPVFITFKILQIVFTYLIKI